MTLYELGTVTLGLNATMKINPALERIEKVVFLEGENGGESAWLLLIGRVIPEA